MKEKIEAKVKEQEDQLKKLKTDLTEIERMIASNQSGQQEVVKRIIATQGALEVLKSLTEDKKEG